MQFYLRKMAPNLKQLLSEKISSSNIQKFTIHVQFKPGLENFEHYFTSM